MLQRYILRQAFWPLMAALSSLGLLALLTQSISQLDLIIDQRQGLLVYLEIVLLTLPQLMALIMPLALFVTTLYAMNRLQGDSELVAAKAAGMSRWLLATPLIKLGVAAMVVNLFVNLWVQPASFRHMRERIYEVRADFAAQLIRPGECYSPEAKITICNDGVEPGGRIINLLIEDATNEGEPPVVYMAKAGQFADIGGEPALVMFDGSAQSLDDNNTMSFLRFDSSPFLLSDIVDAPQSLSYKLSDRYLHELLFPDPYQLWSWRLQAEVLAEGHYRLSSPLYNPALVLIALAALLGGEYSRTGYGRRIAVAAAAALLVRMVGFAVQSACEDDVALNPLQYAVPLAASGAALWIMLKPRRVRRRTRPPPHHRADADRPTSEVAGRPPTPLTEAAA